MVNNVKLPIGLADSELVEYSRSGNEVTVHVRAWNDQKLILRFPEAIGVQDLVAGDFSDLLQDSAEAAAFLMLTLSKAYDALPREHPYHTYTFTNLDGDPALIIAAEDCQVVNDDA